MWPLRSSHPSDPGAQITHSRSQRKETGAGVRNPSSVTARHVMWLSLLSEDKHLPSHMHLLEWSPAPTRAPHTHLASCRPAGAPAGSFASPHNSDTGWLHALGAEGRSPELAGGCWGLGHSKGRSQAPGPEGKVHLRVTQPDPCLAPLGPQVTHLPALIPVPLGSPSCCSSLDKDSPSTLCLAALERMKLSTATVAFTSPDSGGSRGWNGGCCCGPSHLLDTPLSSAQSP